MAALVAAHMSKSFGEVAAVHELIDHFWNHPAQHAVARLIVARGRGHEGIKVRVKALPQQRRVGLASAKQSRDHCGRA
jgi:hypothetical protein